jgi:EF-P beta-lysylation protein EpmB
MPTATLDDSAAESGTEPPKMSLAIAPSPTLPQWRRDYADVITDAAELAAFLRIDPASISAAARSSFALRVPRAFAARMAPGDPHDPLLLQVLPSRLEEDHAEGYGTDPVAELERSPQPGLLHKYRGRVLWVLSGACAIHCRYCFRRHFPYGDHLGGGAAREQVLAHLRADSSVKEVILSGGDPLSLDDGRLAELARELAAIPHLERLRVHTRLPVVIPSRVDEALLAWLTGTRLTPVVVLHVNHAHELDAEVGAAIGRLRERGVTLLNQAVLLAGVNDGVEALVELSERLFAVGVLPYYLHQLDRVQGAAHFEVSDARARALMAEVAVRLPGYLVPRLVRDDGRSLAKVVV